MGMKPSDVRYHADGEKTATADLVVFPMSLLLDRPTHQAALQEAKDLIEQLRAEMGKFRVDGVKFELADLTRQYEQETAKLKLEQVSKEEVRLEMDFFLLLQLEQKGQFWERANTIAQHLDFVQRFCLKPRDRKTTLWAETAKLVIGVQNTS